MVDLCIFLIILLSVLIIVLFIIIFDMHVSSQILKKDISTLKEKLSLNETLLSIYKDCINSERKYIDKEFK